MGDHGNMNIIAFVRSLGLFAISMLLAIPVFCATAAHGEDAEAAESASLAIEEVLVTARRREEGLQEAPVSVSALSGDRLDQMGARTFQDFALAVPSLSFVGNNSPENKIVLRGVSTGVVTRDEGSVIGLYVDDVPVGSRRFNPDLRLYDIERVEVLRGPQGTLFGEGSIGGTLRLVTRKPNLDEFDAWLQATGSGTRNGGTNYEAVAGVNLPLVEGKLALRMLGYRVDESGFVDNVTLDKKDVNQTDTSGFRVLARYAPSDQFSITGSILGQDTTVSGKAQYDPELGDLLQARTFDEALGDDFTLANLTFEWDLGGATLVGSTASFDREVVNLRDISPLLRGLPIFLDDLTEFDSLVHEIRISSDSGLFDNRLDWFVGAFHRQDDEFFRQDAQAAALGGDVFDSDNYLDKRHSAVFAEFDWHLTDRLSATAGVRWFRIEQEGRNVNAGLLAGLPPGEVDVTLTDASEEGFNPKFRLSLDLGDNALLYALASQGFREGGPTGQGVPPDPETGHPAPTQFDSDALWNYELGAKLAFAENRVVLNGAIFSIDWEDIQTTSIRSDGHTFTINAGGARSKGVEVELRAILAAGVDIFVSASHVDSTLTADQLPPGDGQAGDRIPGVPKVTFSAGVHFERQISDTATGFLGLNYQHVGDSFNGFGTSTGISAAGADKQDPYDLANLRLGIRSRSWQATLFANNLTDERAVLFFNRIVGDVRINTNRPRTVGLEIRYRF